MWWSITWKLQILLSEFFFKLCEQVSQLLYFVVSLGLTKGFSSVLTKMTCMAHVAVINAALNKFVME